MPKKPTAKAAETATKPQPKGKLAYEHKRAAKAGQSHEDWLKAKAKTAAAAAKDAKKAAPKPEKKPGLLKRLIEKAHKPI